MPQLSPRKRAYYLRLIESNRWSDTRIAKRIGLHKTTVGQARKRRELPKVKFPTISPLKIKKIVALHLRGYDYERIGLIVSLSARAVAQVIRHDGAVADPSHVSEKRRIRRMRSLGATPKQIAIQTGHDIHIVNEILLTQEKSKPKVRPPTRS